MKYVINIFPDVEELIVNDLKSHLFTDIRFKKIFPNFGNVRVSGTHPFAFLIESEISGAAEPTGLFPSITVVDDNDMKDPDAPTPVIVDSAQVSATEVADIEANIEKYIISDEDLTILKNSTENNGILYAQGSYQRRRVSIVIEIWSKNRKIKNALYGICMNYFTINGRVDLYNNHSIQIQDFTLSGQKSGNYNFDFGYMLHGGVIRFNASYNVQQYIIDSETNDISGIIHTEQEVKDSDQEVIL